METLLVLQQALKISALPSGVYVAEIVHGAPFDVTIGRRFANTY
ncbi:hypothetical protein P4S63_02135 [Pseudoalteromonas sp. B193]